jgi:NitT/TauT family transport system substrate-binding protein
MLSSGVLLSGARNDYLHATATLGLGTALLRPLGAWAQTASVKDVPLSVPGPGSAVSLPLELAVKLGIDRAEGINLRLKFVGGGGVALKDIQSGDAEFGVFGLPAAMGTHLKDPRVVALAAVEDLPVWVLMVRNSLRGTVRRVTDLKGRTIGNHSSALSTKTTGDQITELVLSSRGIAVDSVRMNSAGQNWETQSAALVSGSVDAIMTDEPFATRMASEKIAFPIYSTGNPADAKRTPGAGFLRAALIGRRDRVDANPAAAERMVKVIRRTLEWMATHTPEQMADALELKAGEERASFLTVARKYPRQYSRDAKFSAAQLRDTEVFFRASTAEDAAAQKFAVDSMIIDRWAGRKP